MTSVVFFTFLQVFTMFFHCLISNYTYFFTVLQVLTLFYKRLQLFSRVLQMFTTVFTLFYKCVFLSLFYLATINGCCCYNALREIR